MKKISELWVSGTKINQQRRETTLATTVKRLTSAALLTLIPTHTPAMLKMRLRAGAQEPHLKKQSPRTIRLRAHSRRTKLIQCSNLFIEITFSITGFELKGAVSRHFSQIQSLGTGNEIRERNHSRGKWLWKPANFKGDNKTAAIYVGRATTLHNLFFYVDTSS